MTHAQITQCPHCQTRFRVSAAQLAAAHGTVRCGACFKVFTAGSSATETPPPAPEPATATSDAEANTQEQTLWIHDDLDLDILDQELAKLEREERSATNVSESDTLSASLADVAKATLHTEREVFAQLDEPIQPSNPAPRPHLQQFEFDDEPLPLPSAAPKPHWGQSLLWLVLSLLAAIALLGQYCYYHFDTLARQPETRPLLETICPLIGCTLPAKVDIAQLRSSNLVVRAHPKFSGALQLDAIIYNRASFAQPFPVLDVRFSDTKGHVQASRQFRPSEYLAGELAGQHLMPPQTPIRIALEIIEPGHNAQSYSLNFLSP